MKIVSLSLIGLFLLTFVACENTEEFVEWDNYHDVIDLYENNILRFKSQNENKYFISDFFLTEMTATSVALVTYDLTQLKNSVEKTEIKIGEEMKNKDPNCRGVGGVDPVTKTYLFCYQVLVPIYEWVDQNKLEGDIAAIKVNCEINDSNIDAFAVFDLTDKIRVKGLVSSNHNHEFIGGDDFQKSLPSTHFLYHRVMDSLDIDPVKDLSSSSSWRNSILEIQLEDCEVVK